MRSTMRSTVCRTTTRRSPSGSAPTRRVLAVAGALAAVLVSGVLLGPGTAWADDGTAAPAPPADPLGGLAGTVGGLLGGRVPGEASPAGDGAAPGPVPAGALTAPGPAPGNPAPADPAPSDPSAQLQQLLQQLQQHAQISPDCVNGVLQDVRVVISDIPQALQDLAAQLAAGLQQGGSMGTPVPLGLPQPNGTQVLTLPAARPSSSGTGVVAVGPPSDLQGSPLAGDLQKLAKDFTYDCLPQPPSAPAVAGGVPQEPAGPVVEEPSAPAEQPATEPVTYPGYAPTGGSGPGSPAATGPLAAIGAGLLLGGAGAAGHRMRSRAPRGRG